MVELESTQFLRKFTNFLSHQPFSSLPSLTLATLVAFALLNFVLVVLYETENVEKRLKGIAEFFIVACVFTCLIKRTTNPGKVNKILDLIEGQLLVEESKKYPERSCKWEKIHANYGERRKIMETLYGKMSVISVGLLFGYIGRNVFSGSEENLKDWPTPYVYWCPTGYDSKIYFVIVETLHIGLLMFLLAEGFSLLLTTCLATERVLADFVTIYMLLEDLIKDFDSDSSMKQENGFKRHVDLRNDMIILIQCHQNLNRNFKQCADYSAYGSIICTVIIYADTVASTYTMLKAYNFKMMLYFAFTCIFVNLVILFCYHNGQKIVNQNDYFRQYLAEIPWIDKPHWFKTSLCIMMRRANIDTQLKPYNVFVMNHESFKNILKTAFSFGNIIYSVKSNSL